MDKSSQMPSTPTPTPPMFPPHGMHGHGHVQFTPPSITIPGIASGPVQSGVSPSSRQVMDMSAHPYPHPYHQVPQFSPQHMQSGNYPYQNVSPAASPPRPPPQQQPHPLTHGLGLETYGLTMLEYKYHSPSKLICCLDLAPREVRAPP
jgi:hypothetical protein